ncbi:MAG: response regulator [Pseudomonadota bacterium]
MDAQIERPPKRVALIDDSLAVRRSLSLLLRANGFDVIAFEKAEDAIECRPDVDRVLIDYRLPGTDGIALLRTLRNLGVNAPAILISGVIAPRIDELAKRAGFASFLRKPMNRADLLDALG